MKTSHFQFSRTLNYFYLFVFMIVAACNHFTGNHDNAPPKNIFAPDTLLTPAGDANLDSLLHLAANTPQDTVLADLYNKIAHIYMSSDLEKAHEYQLKALSELTSYYENNDLSKALHYAWQQKEMAKTNKQPEWLADAYTKLGGIYYWEHQADSADYYHRLSLDEWTKLNNPDKIARALVNISNVMRMTGQPDSVLILLQKALEIYEERKSEEDISQVLANIASNYNDLGNHQKHDEYALKALEIQERIGSGRSLGITLINLSVSMTAQQKFDEAIVYGERAISVFRTIEQPYVLCFALIRTASAYSSNGDINQAIKYLDEAIPLSEASGSQRLKIEILRERAYQYMALKEYTKAKADAKEALELTDIPNESKIELVFLYDVLSITSIHTNEKEDALHYLNLHANTKNDLQQQTWVEQLSEMEVKYETEKKELKIASLEERQRFITWLSISAGVVLVLALSALFFLWRFTVQKRQLAETRIVQLEKEKQLIATQAVLDGEIQERTRLARDLHDGLGGMLTGVKLHLQEMKKSVKIEASEVARFDEAMDLLDNSVREMRRVSHNLMPDALSRFGLKPAVDDFCCSLSSPVVFDFYGAETRLEPKLELLIYRCIHELVNNALKYSGASQIMVQIMQEPDRIAITVQDDGCGFDPQAETQGTGLKNIRTRVTSFGGSLMIDTKANKGTEINIEIQLNS